METFGKSFKKQREFRRVKKEAFCSAIGIDLNILEAIEAGEKAPPQDEQTFATWLEASAIPLDKLVRGILWNLAQDF